MPDEIQTILVVDDHPLMRKGILQLIAMEPSLRLVGEAGDGQQGVELAHRLRPDLILLDLNMRGLSGMEALKALKAADLDTRVIILTVSDSEEDVVAALRLGADGYLLKDMEPEHLIARLREVLRGTLVISPSLTTVLAQALRAPQSASSLDLTDRERQVLKMIAAGLSNKMIGNKLGITEGTVKVHVKNLLHKLGLRSRVEAAVWALEHLG